jgi:YidC/Oxa1 family membrane protein insertase
MEKRTLLALGLAFIVLLVYQYLFVKPAPQQVQNPAKVEEKEKPAPAATQEPVVSVPRVQPVSAEEKELKVETDLYSAVFSTRGATVKHFELKKYKDKEGKNVVLLRNPGVEPPLAIGSKDDFDLANANFHTTGKDLTLGGNEKSGSFIFEYANAGVIQQ